MPVRLTLSMAVALATASPAMSQEPAPVPPIVHLDQVRAVPRPGHEVFPLLGKAQNTSNGFNSLVGVYTSLDFVITGTHADQEMFYVIEGSGTALVGTEEFPIRPGSCWFVKPGQVHGIRRNPDSPHVKAFVVHGAP